MHRFCVTGSVLVGVVDNDSIPHRTPSQDGREEDDLHATIESQFTGWGFEEAMRRIAETNESHVAAAPRLGSLHKPLLEGHGTSVGQRVILREHCLIGEKKGGSVRYLSTGGITGAQTERSHELSWRTEW